MTLRKWEYQSYFSTNQSSEKLTALQLFWQNSSVITNSWTKCFETSLKSQIFPIHKYIFMNGKSQYPVFFKNHAAVTPELVVNRLRRINTYIWLFNKSYSQRKCQFVQKTFGNTGQQQDAIRISVFRCFIYGLIPLFQVASFCFFWNNSRLVTK